MEPLVLAVAAMNTPGEPLSEQLARELADLVAEDGSRWSYSAKLGGYVSLDHLDVICRDAAAVASHVGGPSGTVRKAP